MKIKLLNNNFINELCDDIKSNKFFYFGTIFSAFVFFIIIRNIVLATHDDIQFYILFRRYGFIQNLLRSISISIKYGRIFQFISYFPAVFTYLFNNIIFYKVIFNIYILFSVISLWYLIFKHINKTIALMVVFVFFSFAQINMQHNGFISFPGAQLYIGFIFLSIEKLISYYKNEKKCNLIWSSIFLLIPTLLYEAFIIFSIMLFLISVIHYYKNNNILKSIINSFKDLILHIILMSVYLVIYFIVRFKAENIYPGAELKISSVGDSLYALIMYTIGSFPLFTFIRIFSNINVLEYINFISVLKAIIASVFIIIIFKKINKCKIDNINIIIWLAVLGIILPVLLISVTPLHVDWARNHGVYTHLPSYYSYFFISVFLSFFCVFIFVKFKYNNIFFIIVIIIFFFGSLFTDVSNRYYAEQFDYRLKKYKAIDKMLSSKYFNIIENGADIYLPDFIGIHYSMYAFNDVLPKNNLNKYNFTNNKDTLLFDKPTYILNYNDYNKTMNIKKISNNNYF